MAKLKNKKGKSDGKKKKTPAKSKSALTERKEAIKRKKLNPFEVHINKQKFEVLGRKVKHDRGLPGVSRAKAVAKRKTTLLQEYRVMDKTNKFMDRRIGENNKAMTGEDRIMARFTAERMKTHNKKSMFNLADDEVLTHHGQTLNELEKFDDPRSDDEDETETGRLDASFVKEAHFGGGIFTKPGDPQSRKDLIEQLIVESKRRKAEQKKSREQTQELTDKLDTEWKDLLPIIATSKRKPAEERPPEPVEKPDDFDTTMRELRFEARGRPSDRLKSEDEIAKEEKARLEGLEADRLKRMHGISDSDKPKITHRSADDLDDGFAMPSEDEDANNILSYDADGQVANHLSSGMDYDEEIESDGAKSEKESSSDDESSGEDEEDDLADLKTDSDEENVSIVHEVDASISQAAIMETEEPSERLLDEIEVKSEVESDDEMTTVAASLSIDLEVKDEVKIEEETESKTLAAENIKKDLLARKIIMDTARKELPYTFKVPENYEELQALFANQSPEYQSVILERVIKCNHPSLADGNKDKLTTLLAFLLQHLHDVAIEDDGECFVVLDRLAPHLYDLAIMSPQNARRCVAEVLKEKQHDYQKRPKSFPSQDTLVFLKLISLLFPTSDFRHPVCTPAFVFMCQMLANCNVVKRSDISAGLFLSTMILEFTVLSKRFPPEVILFLTKLIGMKNLHQFSSECGSMSAQSCKMSIKEMFSVSPWDDTFRYKVLAQAFKLLEEFRSNLKNLPAAFQVFQPILTTKTCMPKGLKEQLKTLRSAIKEMGARKMPRLAPPAKKPKVMRLYEPNIEKVYDFKSHKVMGHEKQEIAKLQHKLKRETKGAIREVRRDRAFLAKLKFQETKRDDEARNAKVREIYGDAANQLSEINNLDRKKKK